MSDFDAGCFTLKSLVIPEQISRHVEIPPDFMPNKSSFTNKMKKGASFPPVGRPGSGAPREKGLRPGSGPRRGPALAVGR